MSKYFKFSVIFILSIFLLSESSCDKKDRIKYIFYSNKKEMFEINGKDILYYDTSMLRSGYNLHQMRLKHNSYKKDSFYFYPPAEISCLIDGKTYFWGQIFHRNQAEPRWFVNYNFNSNCDNSWNFPIWNFPEEYSGGCFILKTNNECNNIEFFHRKNQMWSGHKYYSDDQFYKAYRDTARFAHEILLDSFYIRALKDSGVEIR